MKSGLELGPPLVAAAAVGGTLLGERAGGSGALVAVAVGGVAALASWYVRGRSRLVIACVAVVLVAGASMQRALHGLERGALVGLVEVEESVELRGSIASDPEQRVPYSTEVTVRVDSVRVAGSPRWEHAGGRHVAVRAGGDEASAFRVLEAGDRVALVARLHPLTGFRDRLRWAHVVGEATDARLVEFGPATNPAFVTSNAVRALVARGAARLRAPDDALALGFLLGDTRGVPDRIVDDFRESGLSHLLAVSGANVAFVLALAAPLLSRLRLGTRFVAGVGLLVIFALATRWEPSVLRACAMAACAMSASFVGRPISSLRLLSIAVVVLVVADPFLVHQVGFALSCAASLGIVLLDRPIRALLHLPRVVADPLAVTLAAQIGVAPVLLAVFGSLPLLAPVTNLFAVPLAEPITVLGLPAAALAGSPAGGPVGVALLAPIGALVRWTRTVAAAASGAGPMLDRRALGPLLVAYVVLASRGWWSSRTRASDSATPSSTRATARW